jgi:hypothetical protein
VFLSITSVFLLNSFAELRYETDLRMHFLAKQRVGRYVGATSGSLWDSAECGRRNLRMGELKS